MLHFVFSTIECVSKEAQRAVKGKPPSGQTVSEEQKVTKEPVKDGTTGTNEPTKPKSELKAERRAKQVGMLTINWWVLSLSFARGNQEELFVLCRLSSQGLSKRPSHPPPRGPPPTWSTCQQVHLPASLPPSPVSRTDRGLGTLLAISGSVLCSVCTNVLCRTKEVNLNVSALSRRLRDWQRVKSKKLAKPKEVLMVGQHELLVEYNPENTFP